MMNWLELIVFLSSFVVFVVVAFVSFEFSKTPTHKYAASYPSYLFSSHTSFVVLLSSQFSYRYFALEISCLFFQK